MDQVCDLNNEAQLIAYLNRAKEHLSPDFLLILLGPTASGKTALAVRLAEALNGEIISADSRQVYRNLDIGTGKDLKEYGTIPYHLIDIIDPTAQYQVQSFKKDFMNAYHQILKQGKLPILCGGTGSYIHSLLQELPYAQVPKDTEFHDFHEQFSKEELRVFLSQHTIPTDFQIDMNNKKRLIRALEIVHYLEDHPLQAPSFSKLEHYMVVGLNPPLAIRRSRIDQRLSKRLQEGLIEEVNQLLQGGIGHQQLQWFGLEYKYASYYLLGEITYGEFTEKLKTEIHRFAKRQMTFFRKMEKDGVKIHWMDSPTSG